MNTNTKAIPLIGHEGTINTKAEKNKVMRETRERRIVGRMKHFINKLVTVDEDWIFKSKEWPYLWIKK